MSATLNMLLSGKLLEVGLIRNGFHGFQLEVQGEVIEVTGLTVSECQTAALFIGEQVMVTVRMEKA